MPRGRGAAVKAGLCAACLLAACWSTGCGKQDAAGQGVVVRQVLRGAEATAADPPAPMAPANPSGAPAGLSQAIAPLGSTLVADTSRAVYRRSLEQARKNSAELSGKQRLNAIEAQMEDDEEETP